MAVQVIAVQVMSLHRWCAMLCRITTTILGTCSTSSRSLAASATSYWPRSSRAYTRYTFYKFSRFLCHQNIFVILRAYVLCGLHDCVSQCCEYNSHERKFYARLRLPYNNMVVKSVYKGYAILRNLTRSMAIANWTCVSWVAYAPGTIAVNVTWIEREFNACQTPHSMYPSIFNHFWNIAVADPGVGPPIT